MKKSKIVQKFMILFCIALALFTACENKTAAFITDVKLKDGTNTTVEVNTALPKFTFTCLYSDGTTTEVNADVTMVKGEVTVKSGETIPSKGKYTATAVHEGKTVTFDVSVTGPALIRDIIIPTDHYIGDTISKENITFIYEDESGITESLNGNSEGVTISGNESLKADNTLTISYKDATETKDFKSSKGLVLSKMTIENISTEVNKDTSTEIDLSNAKVSYTYSDGGTHEDYTTTPQEILFTAPENTTITDKKLTFDANNFNAASTIVLTHSFTSKAVKADGTLIDVSDETKVSGEHTITIIQNPVVKSFEVNTYNGNKTHSALVEGDTLADITFTLTLTNKLGQEKSVSSSELTDAALSSEVATKGTNTLTFTYDGIKTTYDITAIAKATPKEIQEVISNGYYFNTTDGNNQRLPENLSASILYTDNVTRDIKLIENGKLNSNVILKVGDKEWKDLEYTENDVNKEETITISFNGFNELSFRSESAELTGEDPSLTGTFTAKVLRKASISNVEYDGKAINDYIFYNGFEFDKSKITYTYTNSSGQPETVESEIEVNNGVFTTGNKVEITITHNAASEMDCASFSLEKTVSAKAMVNSFTIIEDPQLSVKLLEDNAVKHEALTVLNAEATYSDGTKKTVNLIGHPGVYLTIDGENYTDYSFLMPDSYGTLPEKSLMVTIDSSLFGEEIPQTEVATEVEVVPGVSLTITQTRDAKIENVKLNNHENLYVNSVIKAEDISFDYINTANEKAEKSGNDATELTFNETAFIDGKLTLASTANAAKISLKYENISGESESSYEIQADAVASLNVTNPTNLTYSLVSNTFSSEGLTVTKNYLSGKTTEALTESEKNTIKFFVAGEPIENNKVTKGGPLTFSVTAEGKEFNDQPAGTIIYHEVTAIAVADNSNAPERIILSEEIDPSQFIGTITATINGEEKELNNTQYAYETEVSGKELHKNATISITVTADGHTETITKNVLVVANEYEQAINAEDIITIEANSAETFHAPAVFNRTEDGKAIAFVGYYNPTDGSFLNAYGLNETPAESVYMRAVKNDTADANDPKYSFVIKNDTAAEVKLYPAYELLENVCEVKVEAEAEKVKTTITSGVNADGEKISSTVFFIPKAVTAIESDVFQNNENIKVVGFESKTTITEIAGNAFSYIDLRYFELPASVTTLQVGTFANNGAATDGCVFVILTEGLALNNYQFSNTNAYELVFPAGTTVNSSTFVDGAKFLTRVVFQDTIKDTFTELPANIFSTNTHSLREIILPSSCTTIGENALANTAIALESFNFTNIETIGAGAFSDVTGSLVTGGNLVIPAKVKTIGDNAFENVELTSITINNDKFTLPGAPWGAVGKSGNNLTVTYTVDVEDRVKSFEIRNKKDYYGRNEVTETNPIIIDVTWYSGDATEHKITAIPSEAKGNYTYQLQVSNGTASETIKVELNVFDAVVDTLAELRTAIAVEGNAVMLTSNIEIISTETNNANPLVFSAEGVSVTGGGGASTPVITFSGFEAPDGMVSITANNVTLENIEFAYTDYGTGKPNQQNPIIKAGGQSSTLTGIKLNNITLAPSGNGVCGGFWIENADVNMVKPVIEAETYSAPLTLEGGTIIIDGEGSTTSFRQGDGAWVWARMALLKYSDNVRTDVTLKNWNIDFDLVGIEDAAGNFFSLKFEDCTGWKDWTNNWQKGTVTVANDSVLWAVTAKTNDASSYTKTYTTADYDWIPATTE